MTPGSARAADAVRQLRHRRLAWGHGLGALAAVAILVSLVRLAVSGPGSTGDTFWYARQTFELNGHTEATANELASRLMANVRGDDPAAWLRVAGSIDPRYPAIFTARPLYPLAANAMLPTDGFRGLLLVSVLAGAVCALAVASAGRLLSGSSAIGLLAGLLTVLLPSGQWFRYLLADGLMLGVWAIALHAATRFRHLGGTGWLVVFATAVAGLWLAKSANGAALVLGVALAPLATGFPTLRSGRTLRLLVVGVGVGIGYVALSWLLGFAGIGDSLQDLATGHFALPDSGNPVGDLLSREGSLLTSLPGMVASAAVPIGLVVVGLVALRRFTKRADVWLSASLCCVTLVAVHPLPSEIPRLMAPVWLAVAIGLSWVLVQGGDRLLRSRGARSRPYPRPAARSS
jgi:hypothetical protein